MPVRARPGAPPPSPDASRAGQILLSLSRGALGELIIDNVFLPYRFPDRSVHTIDGRLPMVFGLAPIQPPTRFVYPGPPSPYERASALRTTEPRLAWSAFPRAVDFEQAPDAMARVRNVRDDLLIAREERR